MPKATVRAVVEPGAASTAAGASVGHRPSGTSSSSQRPTVAVAVEDPRLDRCDLVLRARVDLPPCASTLFTVGSMIPPETLTTAARAMTASPSDAGHDRRAPHGRRAASPSATAVVPLTRLMATSASDEPSKGIARMGRRPCPRSHPRYWRREAGRCPPRRPHCRGLPASPRSEATGPSPTSSGARRKALRSRGPGGCASPPWDPGARSQGPGPRARVIQSLPATGPGRGLDHGRACGGH